MGTRQDFIGINNPAIFAWADSHGLAPAWLKEASIPTEEDIQGLNKVAFANPYLREFPCHTKEATMMSAIWDAANGAIVADNIKKFAEAHGIRTEVENVYNSFEAEQTKSAAITHTPHYAFVLTDDDGNDFAFNYDISDKDNLIRSASALVDDFKSHIIDQHNMRKIAHIMVKTAAANGMDEKELPIQVRLFGVNRLPDFGVARLKIAALCDRKNIDFTPYGQILDVTQDTMQKLAGTAETMELGDLTASAMWEAGLDYEKNGWSIEDNPYNLIFCGVPEDEFEKAANATVFVQDVAIPREAITSLSDEDIDARLSGKSACIVKAAKALLAQEDKPAYMGTEKLATLSTEGSKALLYILSHS